MIFKNDHPYISNNKKPFKMFKTSHNLRKKYTEILFINTEKVSNTYIQV